VEISRCDHVGNLFVWYFSGLVSADDFPYRVAMKRHKKLILAGCTAFALAASFLFPGQSHGQDPAATADDDTAAITAIITEITGQQAQLAAGQVAIDQRLGVIEENVRIARIFSSRGGGGK